MHPRRQRLTELRSAFAMHVVQEAAMQHLKRIFFWSNESIASAQGLTQPQRDMIDRDPEK